MATAPVTVWHLELRPEGFRPSGKPAGYQLERLTAAAPRFYRHLYEAVGGDWHWTDRLPWSPEQWQARLADPAVEVWVAYEGGAPAGWFELCRGPEEGTVEVAYFGLLPHAIGRGMGGALLSDAVRRAWALGAGRVYVNTCSLDHPGALANYQARGFEVFREEEVVKERKRGREAERERRGGGPH